MTSLSFRVRTFWKDSEALAAIEFAMVLPFVLLLYVGGIELANGMAINVKVTAAAHSVADMVSQNTQVSTTQLQTILGASTAILAPYPTTNGGSSLTTVTVSEVSTDSNGNATVQWSQSYNGTNFGTGRPVGQRITLPTSLSGSRELQCLFHPGRRCVRLYAQSWFHHQRDPDAQRQLLPFPALLDQQPCQRELSVFRRQADDLDNLYLHPASTTEDLVSGHIPRASRWNHTHLKRRDDRTGCRRSTRGGIARSSCRRDRGSWRSARPRQASPARGLRARPWRAAPGARRRYRRSAR